MRTTSFTPAQIENEIASLAARCGKSEAFLRAVFDRAGADTRFDEKTVLSRLKWLMDRRGDTGIALGDMLPDASENDIASHIVSPKRIVLEFIRAKSGLPEDMLLAVYDAMRNGAYRSGRWEDYYKIDDLSEERMLQEMKWWIVDLKFPKYYFDTTPPEGIAAQIVTNRFYEIQGIDSAAYTGMKLSYTSPDGTSIYWAHRDVAHEVEREIEDTFSVAFDLAMYVHGDLRLFIVEKGDPNSGTTYDAVITASLKKDKARAERYRSLWEKTTAAGSMVIERSSKDETGEQRLMIGIPAHAGRCISHASQAIGKSNIALTRLYAIRFSGKTPVIIMSCYSKAAFPENIAEHISDAGLLRENEFTPLVNTGDISVPEALFITAASHFVHQFASVNDPALALLKRRLAGDGELSEIITTIKRRMDKDRFACSAVADAFADRPDIIKDLFAMFTARLSPRGSGDASNLIAAFNEKRKTMTLSNMEAAVIDTALLFLTSVVRTNFFIPEKKAISFRLASDFLDGLDFPARPFGIFFVVGQRFTGFHVRFTDIARGGIRIVRSASYDDYVKNANNAFEECFNLAYTQNKKNKDIPEGGSKGIILLSQSSKDAPADPASAFRDYVDGILDLILPEHRTDIRNYEEEILFLGPDEGTADLMDWACERARDRGYRYWKGFTTGKAAYLGGVSHIDYGMTTNGIHEYVLGILEKRSIDEKTVTKVQTGGPDGDLGSNEILVSKDKTIAIIDGGGVLYDPRGLDRGELTRLAKARIDSGNFDEKKLSAGGFKVRVSDRNVTLPDGTIVVSGAGLRNSFHLDARVKADLFVPCGGRPKSIDGTNWQTLIDADGTPKYRFIVEGANLFITQDARIALEKKGVILFKDSSTNKGGVTSSSLEVLSGLALTDTEFKEHMMLHDGKEPAFRKRYIDEIVAIVRTKSRAEFEVLWRLAAETKRPISELSDLLSAKINEITAAIVASDLFADTTLRAAVLTKHVPVSLVVLIGMKAVMERVPVNYQKAIVARTVASTFVYTYGISPGYEDYRAYLATFRR